MKSFERLVLSHLKTLTDPLLDLLEFAYRANRFVGDALNTAFNTIIPSLLHVPDSTCKWITDFLSDRKQDVNLGKHASASRTIRPKRLSSGCSS
ncbi:uncharacterized protein ACO6RY_00902 [Pungitius sinensis]